MISKSLGAFLFALVVSICAIVIGFIYDSPEMVGVFIVMSIISAMFVAVAIWRKW